MSKNPLSLSNQTPRKPIVLDLAALPAELHSRFPNNSRLVTVIMLKIEGWTEEKIGQEAFLPKTLNQSNVSRVLTRAGVRLYPSEGNPKTIYLPQSGGKEAVTLLIKAKPQAGIKLEEPSDESLFNSTSSLSDVSPPPDNWRDAVIMARENRDKNRGEVEDAAVNAVEAYYRKCGYTVESVETRDRGWDLEFRKDGCAMLCVEVKGTSTAKWSRVEVELTRKECEQSENPKCQDSYRLAIVRDALENPKCAIYTRDGDGWKRADDFAGDDKGAPDCLKMHPSKKFVIRADLA